MDDGTSSSLRSLLMPIQPRLRPNQLPTSTVSARVLEKAGYVCEGPMPKSVIKDGQVIDQFLYAITR